MYSQHLFFANKRPFKDCKSKNFMNITIPLGKTIHQLGGRLAMNSMDNHI